MGRSRANTSQVYRRHAQLMLALQTSSDTCLTHKTHQSLCAQLLRGGSVLEQPFTVSMYTRKERQVH